MADEDYYINDLANAGVPDPTRPMLPQRDDSIQPTMILPRRDDIPVETEGAPRAMPVPYDVFENDPQSMAAFDGSSMMADAGTTSPAIVEEEEPPIAPQEPVLIDTVPDEPEPVQELPELAGPPIEAMQELRRGQDLDKVYQIAIDPKPFQQEHGISERRAKGAVNTAFLKTLMASDISGDPSDIGRQAAIKLVGQQMFPEQNVKDEDSLFAAVQGKAVQRRDENELLESIQQYARKSAIVGEAGGLAMQGDWEAIKQMPGYDPAKTAEYIRASRIWEEQAANLIRPYRATIDAIIGEADTGGTFEEMGPAEIISWSEEQWQDILQAFHIVAQGMTEENRESWLKGAGKSAKRAGTDIIYGSVRFGVSKAMQLEAIKEAGLAQIAGLGADQPKLEEAFKTVKDFEVYRDRLGDLDKIFRGEYDPIEKSGKWYVDFPQEIPSMTASMGLMIGNPLALIGGTIESVRNSLYQNARAQGFTEEQSRQYRNIVSPAVSAPVILLEKLQLDTATGKIPGYNKLLVSISNKFTNKYIRGGARAITTTAIEAGQEVTQDIADTTVREIASWFGEEMPTVEWTDEMVENALRYPEYFVGMLAVGSLSMVGGAHLDQAAEALKQDLQTDPKTRMQMIMAGANSADLNALEKAEGMGETNEAFQKIYENLDPQSEEAKEMLKNVKKAQEFQERMAAAEAEVRDMRLPVFTLGENGYTVTDGSTGEVIGEGLTHEQALETSKEAFMAVQAFDDTMTAELASILLAQEKMGQEGGKAEISLGSKSALEHAKEQGPEQEKRFWLQVERMKQSGELREGVDPALLPVFGANYLEDKGAGKGKQIVTKIFGGGRGLMTVFHEEAHGYLRTAIANNTMTWGGVYQFFRDLDKGLKNKFLSENFGEVAPDGKFTQQQMVALDEAVAELMEVEIMRTRKKGGMKGNIEAAKIREGLLASMKLRARDASYGVGEMGDKARAARGFGKILFAARHFWKTIFSRLTQIRAGIASGEISEADIEKFTNTLFGLDEQAEFDKRVGQEAESLGPAPDVSGEALSIGNQSAMTAKAAATAAAKHLEKADTSKTAIPLLANKRKMSKVTFADMLEEMFQGEFGEMSQATKEDRAKVGKRLAAEVAYQLKKGGGSGMGWYLRKVKSAMATMRRVEPTFADHPLNEIWFTIFTALTSQGQAVDANFENGHVVYKSFIDNGRKFPTRISFGGEARGAMEANLEKLAALVDRLGEGRTILFMLRQFTVGDLKSAGFDVSGEAVEFVAMGSQLMGPKIGAFFANLNGNFDPVTMDLWFTRSMRRHFGRLFGRVDSSLKAKAKGKNKPGYLRRALAELRAKGSRKTELEQVAMDEILALLETEEGTITRKYILKNAPALAQLTAEIDAEVQGMYTKAREEKRSSKTVKKTEFQQSMVGIRKAITMLEDAPTGQERPVMREIVEYAQEELRKSGINLTNADFQAILWFFEKDLYVAFDATSTTGEKTDYAEAAKKLERKLTEGKELAPRVTRSGGGGFGIEGRGAYEPVQANSPAVKRLLKSVSSDAASGAERSAAARYQSRASGRRPRGVKPDVAKQALTYYLPDPALRVDLMGADPAALTQDLDRLTKDLKSKSASVEALSDVRKREDLQTGAVELVPGAASSDLFHSLITESKIGNKHGSSVYVYPVEDYASMRLFVMPDGKSGFALKEDGDLVSVFSTARGRISQMLTLAIQQGAQKLDCFNTVLPDIYAAHGFEVVAKTKWDNEQAPPDWDKDTYKAFNNGEPDVVFMVYKGGPRAEISQAIGSFPPANTKGIRHTSYDTSVGRQQKATEQALEEGQSAEPAFSIGDFEPVASKMDAERRFADGKSLVAMHEMDEEIVPIESIEMISHYSYDTIYEVKSRASMGIGPVTPQMDNAYMAAVELGDMDTAQAMVIDAAEAAGYDTNKRFSYSRGATREEMQKYILGEQGKPIYLTPNDSIAYWFAESQAGGGVRQYFAKADATATPEQANAAVMEDIAGPLKSRSELEASGWVFKEIKIANLQQPRAGNPLMYYEQFVRDGVDSVWLIQQDLFAGKEWLLDPMSEQQAFESFSSYFMSEEEAVNAAANAERENATNAAGYYPSGSSHLDSRMAKSIKLAGFDSVRGPIQGNMFAGAEELVLLSPNQVKLADPVTRDDAGNVIPLSERFNEQSVDIRYSFGYDMPSVPLSGAFLNINKLEDNLISTIAPENYEYIRGYVDKDRHEEIKKLDTAIYSRRGKRLITVATRKIFKGVPPTIAKHPLAKHIKFFDVDKYGGDTVYEIYFDLGKGVEFNITGYRATSIKDVIERMDEVLSGEYDEIGYDVEGGGDFSLYDYIMEFARNFVRKPTIEIGDASESKSRAQRDMDEQRKKWGKDQRSGLEYVAQQAATNATGLTVDLAPIAQQLLDRLPDDVLKTPNIYNARRRRAAASWHGNYISLGNSAVTYVHEVMHVATQKRIQDEIDYPIAKDYIIGRERQQPAGAEYLRRIKEQSKSASPEMQELVRLYLLANSNFPQLTKQSRASGDPMFYQARKEGLPSDLGYGLANMHEFVAQTFSSKPFQEALNQIPDPKAKGMTLWQSLINAVRKMFGLNVEQGSVLESVIAATAEIAEMKAGPEVGFSIANMAATYVPETEQEVKAANSARSNKQKARSPILAVAAVRLANGEITVEDYADAVDVIDPFVAKGIETPPTEDEIRKYISSSKVAKVGVKIEPGTPVEARIDIPTWNASTAAGNSVYAVTLHEPVAKTAKKVGTPLSYVPMAHLKNVEMMTRAISGKGGAIRIATGQGKTPLATVAGEVVSTSVIPEDISEYAEVSYNPIRSSGFRDVSNRRLVIGGEEAVSIGSRVYVKNPEYGQEPTGFIDPLTPEADIRYSLGPAAMAGSLADSARRRMMKSPEYQMAFFDNLMKRLGAIQAFIETRGTAYNFDAFGKEFEGKFSDEKEGLLNALAMMEAIQKSLPPDLRGRLGGGALSLAKQDTDEKRLEYLKGRVKAATKVVEQWTNREMDKALDKLFKREKVKKNTAGKKPGGKAGATIHEVFATLREYKDKGQAEVDAKVTGIEAQLNGPGYDTSEDESKARMELNLVGLIGNWREATVSRKIQAIKEATIAFEAGYYTYQLQKLMEKEDRDIKREELRKQTGKAGHGSERDEQVQKDQGLLGKGKEVMLDLLSFEDLLGFIFGKESAIVKRWVDLERKASDFKEDFIQNRMDALDDLFTALRDGNRFKGEELRWKMASQKTIKVQGRQFTEFEALSATMMWMQEDGRRHMEGPKDDNGKPQAGKWNYDQAFVDEIEAKLSDEAKQVRAHLMQVYGKEYGQINPTFKKLNGINLPSNALYSPITVKPVQGTDVNIDPTTGFAMGQGSATPGSLRTRGMAIAEPDFRDVVQTYISHTKQIGHYLGYAPMLQEVSPILRNRDLSNSVEASAGVQARKVLQKWEQYFHQGGVVDAAAQLAVQNLLGRMVGRAAGAILIGRISVIMIQSTQLLASIAEMPVGSFLFRFSKLMTGNLGWGKAFKSDYIQRRLKEMPVSVREAMKGLEASKPNRLKYWVQKAGRSIAGMDALMTAGTYAIVYDYKLKEAGKNGLTGQEAESYATNAAERSVDRVAQPTRAGTRSIFENNVTNPIARVGWAFASEARQKLALGLYRAGSKQRTLGEKGRALAVTWLVGGAFATLLRTMWRDLKDDEDDEVFDSRNWDPTRLILASLTGPLQGVPFLGSAIETGIWRATGEYMPDGDMLSAIPDAMEAAMDIGEFAEQDIDATMKDVETMLSGGALLNDTFAAAASVSHLVRDLYRAIKANLPD